ncbi:MAG: CotH kinase family protein [Ruminococcus sp.]|nr:CotH kinase family protein [Ruminococcus sp.]
MKKTLKNRSIAGAVCLSLLMQTAAHLPANADTNGQVTFNEVCTKNSTYQTSSGNFSDWIELYNSSSTEADISGWGLTDKEAEPYRYVFPNGTKVPANGRLLVVCDSDAAKTNPSIAPFGLSASGETLVLTDSAGQTAQSITFGALSENTSYGQYPEGSGQYYTLRCTPNQSNTAPEGSNAVHQPVFSHDSGFYGSEFSLTLTADEGCDIYYTTDGSDPVAGSKKYTAPLTIKDMTNTSNRLSARTDIVPNGSEAPRGNVDKAAVIRAVAVDSNGRASEYVTKTFLIGKTNSGYYKNMKVVSLVTDPANLFDYNKGIYCLGRVYDENKNNGAKNAWEFRANYSMKGKEWERPASFTMFENGQKVIEQNVGIRIKGAFSRSLAQKSFNVYTRQEYGAAEFDFDFFSGKAVKATNGKSIKKFDGIVLRNGGNDNTGAFFRDSINQNLVTDKAFACQATSECIVLLDGEFWGIYQILEKTNTSYLSDHYGVKKSDIAVIKNGALEDGSDKDLSDWRNLCNAAANGTMSYDEFCEKVDIQSFMDYFAAQIYWANADWPQNNYSAWRSKVIDESNQYSDGKWRMILFDTESGQGLYGSEDKSYSADCYRRIRENGSQLARVFNGLLNYERFRHKFSRTMMDFINTSFEPNRVKDVINSYRYKYKQQVADTYSRFHSGSLSGSNAERRFEGDMNTVTEFYTQRPAVAERTTRSAMRLSSEPRRLNIVNSAESGSILLNSLDLGKINSWSGKYHPDYDLYIKAIPVEGRAFSHWKINNARITNGDTITQSIKIRLEGDATVEAVYRNINDPVPETTTVSTAKTTTTVKTTAATTTTKAVTTTRQNSVRYQVFNEGLTWEDAKNYCESIGGHLAVITSENEQAEIFDAINAQSSTKPFYWLGASRGNDGNFKWITNESMSYTRWDSGKPDNYRGLEHYMIIMKNNGKWDDNELTGWANNIDNMGFVCEWENVSEPAKTTAKTTTAKTTTTTLQGKIGLKTLCKVVQAEHFDYKSGIDTENCSEGGLDVAYIENGEYIGFKDIDLTNVRNIDFRIGSNGARAVLEVRLDAPDGQLIGKMDIKSTSGWQTWETQRCAVSESYGIHDIYFIFTGGEGYLYNINWWRTDQATDKFAIGDLNGDGKVDVYDLCKMKKAVESGDTENFGAADINDDDTINETDLDLLKRFIRGEIKSF